MLECDFIRNKTRQKKATSTYPLSVLPSPLPSVNGFPEALVIFWNVQIIPPGDDNFIMVLKDHTSVLFFTG